MRYLLALLCAAGCSMECHVPSPASPTFPAAAKATDSPLLCLPDGFAVVGADGMGGFLLTEARPARPRAYTTRHRRIVECGADLGACPCEVRP